jgi:osmotically-inducible protein OsmY
MVAQSTTDNPAQRLSRSSIGLLAEERLQASSYHLLQRVRCFSEGGTLILTGSLPSYFLKQMAQETVAPLPGVDQVVNQIQVVRPT